MRLWIIQHYQAYNKLLETGVLRANENYCYSDFRLAYDWMVEKMKHNGLVPSAGVNYPIWAWYKWEGKSKRRDMRESGYAEWGEKIVQLTIEVDDKYVLLSDFDLFHYVLNYWYLPIDIKEQENFEREYTDYGFEWKDLQDFNIRTKNMKDIRRKIEKGWDRIFDLEREDENLIYGSNSNKSIQATFWELKLEQIVKAEVFIAKWIDRWQTIESI